MNPKPPPVSAAAIPVKAAKDKALSATVNPKPTRADSASPPLMVREVRDLSTPVNREATSVAAAVTPQKERSSSVDRGGEGCWAN